MKKRLFYAVAMKIMWLGMHILYRVKVINAERVPREGAFVLCANHSHAMDPVMLAVHIKRDLHFMAKKEIFNNGFNQFFLNLLGAFPVDRGAADLRSYKKAAALLEEGSGLLVFAQGHRTPEFENAKNGAAMFALKAGVPIVPAGISGRYTFFSKVVIRFGEPIPVTPYQRPDNKIKTEQVEALMNNVVSTIKELTE